MGSVATLLSQQHKVSDGSYFFSRRKVIAGGSQDRDTMLEGGQQQLREHQKGKTNNTCRKKRGEHKRQVSHGKLMKNNYKS